MDYLLDTQAVIWFINGDETLISSDPQFKNYPVELLW